jgi:hypothetical protein
MGDAVRRVDVVPERSIVGGCDVEPRVHPTDQLLGLASLAACRTE